MPAEHQHAIAIVLESWVSVTAPCFLPKPHSLVGELPVWKGDTTSFLAGGSNKHPIKPTSFLDKGGHARSRKHLRLQQAWGRRSVTLWGLEPSEGRGMGPVDRVGIGPHSKGRSVSPPRWERTVVGAHGVCTSDVHEESQCGMVGLPKAQDQERGTLLEQNEGGFGHMDVGTFECAPVVGGWFTNHTHSFL